MAFKTFWEYKENRKKLNIESLPEKYKINNNKTDIMKATHIAIGHTPQFEHGINSICNSKVWRCDIGMSRAFTPNYSNAEKSKIQVLEILNGVPTVLD
jgi:hypothetical protein